MAGDQLQLRGGSAAENDAFTGGSREVTVDTTNKTMRVHDGVTAGGTALARADLANVEAAGDLPMGGHKITELAAGEVATDAVCLSQLSAVDSKTTPVGAVIGYAGSAAPAGWLLCAGQNVSRTTYAALFTAIVTTYGAGDGTTTFTLPDLRGRVVAGKDDMGGAAASRLTSGGAGINGASLGASGGAQTHTLTTAQLPAHSHNTVLTNQPAGTGTVGVVHGSNNAGGGSATTESGSGQAHTNVQPTFILNYIIFAGA
ncbi:MAG TPA: tail fiber protein [Kaistia sp.]|jgi:microcystin-dependent protein|nr:tail fiber protein [Kaistia sp.]